MPSRYYAVVVAVVIAAAFACANPEPVVSISVKKSYIVVAQGVFFAGVAEIDGKIITVKTVETVLRSNPNISAAVLTKARYVVR